MPTTTTLSDLGGGTTDPIIAAILPILGAGSTAPPPPTAPVLLGSAPVVSSTPSPGQGIALDVSGKLPPSLYVVRTFTQAISLGPPTAPQDGDIWIATTVDANGTRWAFQYNASSASAYKWEFIGGPPMYHQVVTNEGANFNNAWGNLATDGPVVTLTRAGDYTAVGTAKGILGAGADNLFLGIANGNNNPAFSLAGTVRTAGDSMPLTAQGVFASIAAGTTIKLRYQGGNQVNNWSNRSLFVTPTRIS